MQINVHERHSQNTNTYRVRNEIEWNELVERTNEWRGATQQAFIAQNISNMLCIVQNTQYIEKNCV